MAEVPSELSPGERAIANCNIDDVFLLEFMAHVAPEHIPNQDLPEFTFQHKFAVEERAMMQTRTLSNPPDTVQHIIRYFCRGALTILKPGVAPPSADEVPPEEHILALMTHLIAVDYECPKGYFQDSQAISAFSRNVRIHAWPFWREAVLAEVTRLRLPKVTIPMIKPHTGKASPRIEASEKL